MESITFPLAHFLEFINHQGIMDKLSIRQIIRIQLLIENLPASYTFDELKFMLTPILAKDEEEQLLIQNLFDTYFEKYSNKNISKNKKNERKSKKSNKTDSRSFKRNELQQSGGEQLILSAWKKIFEGKLDDLNTKEITIILVSLVFLVFIFLLFIYTDFSPVPGASSPNSLIDTIR